MLQAKITLAVEAVPRIKKKKLYNQNKYSLYIFYKYIYLKYKSLARVLWA